MTRRRLACAGAVAAALTLAGCAADNSLSGSVGELFPLEVSRVEVLRNDEGFQVVYLNNRGADVDVVVRLSVALAGVELAPGRRIPLEGEYAPGHPRTVVLHQPGGEPARLLPRVKKGDLRLASGGLPGEVTRGDFSMRFESEGGDLGNDRTLVGTFVGTPLDAGFGDVPLP